MTEARRLLSGQTHAISRRTSERRFFLVPTDLCRRVVIYAFAVANQDFPRVQIHVLVAMSNHLELVVSDTHGLSESSQLPDFFAAAHSLIAKAMNKDLERGESFWCPGSYRNTEIHDLPALADRLVYALANPAAADLVETLDDWPGVHFGPEQWTNQEGIPIDRPSGAFFGGRSDLVEPQDPAAARRHRERLRRQRAQVRRAERQADRERGLTHEEARVAAALRRKSRQRERSRERSRATLPDTATLRIVAPPAYRGREAEMALEILARLESREAEHRRRREREDKSVLGREGVLAVPRTSSAGSTEADYDMTPVVACKDPERRKHVLKCLVGWRRRYREARKAWPEERQPFPPGTYHMAAQHGAEVMSEADAQREGLLHAPTGPPASV